MLQLGPGGTTGVLEFFTGLSGAMVAENVLHHARAMLLQLYGEAAAGEGLPEPLVEFFGAELLVRSEPAEPEQPAAVQKRKYTGDGPPQMPTGLPPALEPAVAAALDEDSEPNRGVVLSRYVVAIDALIAAARAGGLSPGHTKVVKKTIKRLLVRSERLGADGL